MWLIMYSFGFVSGALAVLATHWTISADREEVERFFGNDGEDREGN